MKKKMAIVILKEALRREQKKPSPEKGVMINEEQMYQNNLNLALQKAIDCLHWARYYPNPKWDRIATKNVYLHNKSADRVVVLKFVDIRNEKTKAWERGVQYCAINENPITDTKITTTKRFAKSFTYRVATEEEEKRIEKM